MHESWNEFWQRAAGHSWNDYYSRGWGIDPDLARERMDFLQREQERAMFNPYDADLPDEPLFFTNQYHALDFSCQCKNCVRMHTINMQDAAFLRSIGVIWRTLELKSS